MPIPANQRHPKKTVFKIMPTTKLLPIAMKACAILAVNFNHPAEAKHQHFKPLPIDFYSQMVGRFEMLCELVEKSTLTPSQSYHQYHEDLRDARDISLKHMVNTIKAHLTAQQSHPDCFRTTPTTPQKQTNH